MSDFKSVPTDAIDEPLNEPPPYSPTSEPNNPPEPKTGFDINYLKTVPGAMKIIEMVLDILGFICALVDISWAGLGSGFVQWATMSGFIVTLIFFIFHAFNIFGRLPGFWELYEFVYLIIISVEIAVAAIVCAARASFGPSVIAACIFTAIASVMYIIDTVLAYRTWKEAREKRQKEARGGQRSSLCIIF
ncbi:hypothetical protein CHS0354_024300 [Potamilus streckersoni]|uniref:MARVEL domain-containing protein n=1 Tax=Potamilus streckersoni TaxID=2493646 RepID=A0AAE0VGG0_9BIVA|nr:hypothetical protein CHS0354_024300 [Potamilus streckersoni]